MGELLYPYLVAVVAMVLVLAASWFAYLRHHKAAIDHEQKARRIPDFVQYMQLQQDVQRLRDEREALLPELATAKATIAEAETKQQWLAANANALQDTQQLVKQLELTTTDLLAEQQKLAQARQELKDAVAELAKHRSEATVEQARVKVLQDQQAALKQDIQRLDANLAGLKGDIQAKEKQRNDLDAQIAGLKRDEADAGSRIAALKTEIAALEAKRDALRQAGDDLALTNEGLENRIRDLKSEEGRLQGAVSKLQQVAPAGNRTLQLGDLFAPAVLPGVWRAATQQPAEDEALQRVSDHLADRKVTFHPRVVRALHTALKVQADAPLLVLAGISGTGKSLLPQLYAQALGIHTQIVPVQPRWDGPQDLLGFYHHLEGRFKPTELTRALIQFDRWLADEHALLRIDADGDLSDQMLLVLLDEMNLARVEYYFSEFLSRLETRRDIDIEDAIKRSKASIQLELGEAGDQQSAFEVFADRNVLFVGTINEDESTQTLSDKVVDRANVMRFGCPNSLAKPETPGQAQPFAAKHWLAAEHWNGWIEGAPELRAADAKLIEETTEKLKRLMNDLGRAFGHRTSRAIHAYARHYSVRNHPGGVREALADQIELRILPKLRGIDTEEATAGNAIETLRQIVERDLGDEPLSQAIRAARRSHGFHWQGLDRGK
jgi:hypothetical protein